MTIPSRKDPYGQTPPADTTQPTTLKTQLEQATLDAVKELSKVLNNNESTGAEKISAAMKIITLAHGKDGLRIEEEKTDAAKAVAQAIQASRFPTPLDATLARFLEYEGIYEHADHEQLRHYLTRLVQAIRDPKAYFDDTDTTPSDNH